MSDAVPFDNNFILTVARTLEKESLQRMHEIAMLCHARLVAATPVDIGQARAGWTFTLNRIESSVPEIIKRPKGTVGPLIEAPTSQPDAPATKYADVYNISNFVQHVVYLNNGHSSQKKEPKFIEREINQAISDYESGRKAS